MPVQLRFHTGSTGENYVTEELWLLARLDRCPVHPSGGCGLARHGCYERKTPPGTLIARWYCPQGHRTFSLLPDHLAARFPGTLVDLQRVVSAAERAPSRAACVDALRTDPISLPSALRWLDRRVHRVRAVLTKIVTMLPEWFQGCAPTMTAVGLCLTDHVLSDAPASSPALAALPALVQLRPLLAPHLHSLARPIGFLHRRTVTHGLAKHRQHNMGPDPPRGPA
jgi:hypothetical protein